MNEPVEKVADFPRPAFLKIPVRENEDDQIFDVNKEDKINESVPPKPRRMSRKRSIDLLFNSSSLTYPAIMIPETRTRTVRTPRTPTLRQPSRDHTEEPHFRTVSPTDAMFHSSGELGYDDPSRLLCNQYKSRSQEFESAYGLNHEASICV